MPVQFYVTVDGDSIRQDWMPADATYLLPASSFLRKGFRTPALPEGARCAVDWGGFVVQSKWGGDVKYCIEDYLDWLERIPGLQWAALWDLPCEAQLAPDGTEVRRRQQWTAQMAHDFIDEYIEYPWAWIPTIQGQTLDDYKLACDDMEPLIRELKEYYMELGSDAWGLAEDMEEDEGNQIEHFRVGIGSLCARKDVREIWEIVEYVTARFPDIDFHLWGVKVAALKDWPGGIPANVVSTDSAAWNGRFKSDIPTINAEMARLGMSQREYGYKVQLPKYLGSFAKATAIQRERDWDLVEDAMDAAERPDAAWNQEWRRRYGHDAQAPSVWPEYSVWGNEDRTPRREDLAARVARAKAATPSIEELAARPTVTQTYAEYLSWLDTWRASYDPPVAIEPARADDAAAA